MEGKLTNLERMGGNQIKISRKSRPKGRRYPWGESIKGNK